MNDNKSITHCALCGQDVCKMSARGAYLKRTSPMGGPFIGECRPSCERTTGNQDDALLAALACHGTEPKPLPDGCIKHVTEETMTETRKLADLVEISEHGEGQDVPCSVCGADSGQPCSSPDGDTGFGIEHGRLVHKARLQIRARSAKGESDVPAT